MATIDEDLAIRRDVPNQDRVITTAKGDILSIRRPGYCMHYIRRITIGEDGFLRVAIPYTRTMIDTCRGDPLPIWRPGHSLYHVRLTVIACDSFFCVCIPHVYRIIVASRGDISATGRPGHRLNCIGITLVIGAFIARAQCQSPQPAWFKSGIPHLNRLVLACRGNPLPIGRTSYSSYRVGVLMIGKAIEST